MKIQKLFQKTLFGTFFLFGLIAVSTSVLCIYTVDTHLSREYESNSKGIAKTIANASVDIILNRDLSALQSLIDQFVEIQGISYIYITNESGEYLAHTFVPGIPEDIRASDPAATETVRRSLPGMGDFIEVGSPILAGVAGTVHIGMDTGLIALKVQRAIGHQAYLISAILHHRHPRRHLVRRSRRESHRFAPRLRRASRARPRRRHWVGRQAARP